jgi:hypothetical protein
MNTRNFGKITLLALLIMALSSTQLWAKDPVPPDQCPSKCFNLDVNRFDALLEANISFGNDFDTAASQATINDQVIASGKLDEDEEVEGKLNVDTYSDGNFRQTYNQATHEAGVTGLERGDIVRISFDDQIVTRNQNNGEYSYARIKDYSRFRLTAAKDYCSYTPEIDAFLKRWVSSSSWQGFWKSDDGHSMGSYSGGSLEVSAQGPITADSSRFEINRNYLMEFGSTAAINNSEVSVDASLNGYQHNVEVNDGNAEYFQRQVVDTSARAAENGPNGSYGTTFKFTRSGD